MCLCQICLRVLNSSIFRDKDVIVIPDETMDIKNRKVLNILIGPADPDSKLRLVTTKFLDKCDSETISAAVVESLQEIFVPIENLVCFKSDNAPYMIKARRTLKELKEVP